MTKISRRAYAEMLGPTVGDRLRLADTALVIEIEQDLTLRSGGYGEEVKFGGGKTVRDGMGQSQRPNGPGPADADMRLAADYAAAVLADSFDLADLIEKARERFGEKGLWGLASAVTAGQFYPTLKRGIGAALSCEILPAAFREAA